MLGPTAVDRMFEESETIIKALEESSDLSLLNVAGDHFRKALLLAAASHFEHVLSEHVAAFIREQSNGSALVESFVRNKAIARQYHSWFQWDAANANQFFGLFGKTFGGAMKKRIEESDDLQAAMKAFMEIGRERNKLVHQDYATFALDKTAAEIYALYQAATKFVESIPVALRECDSRREKEVST
jgi:hypothetical protein